MLFNFSTFYASSTVKKSTNPKSRILLSESWIW